MSKIFEINVEGNEYYVDGIPDDCKEWTVVKQESYKLSKEEVVLSAFKSEFQFDIKSYKELTEVCSRSTKFTEWLINANLLYSEEAQLPLFLKDIVQPDEYKSVQEDLSRINNNYSKYSLKKRALSEKYKKELAEIDKEQVKEVNIIKNKSSLIKILSMNSTLLPFTLQIQINRYVPNDKEDVQESREVYAREVLINYKRMLCKIVKDNPTINIDELIENNQLK